MTVNELDVKHRHLSHLAASVTAARCDLFDLVPRRAT